MKSKVQQIIQQTATVPAPANESQSVKPARPSRASNISYNEGQLLYKRETLDC